jgi:DNA modification methylase
VAWTLHEGDCLEVMRGMPDKSVDLVITSPPYDGIRDYGKDWSIDLHAVGVEVFRLLKDGGIAVMVIQDQTKDFAKSLTSFRTIIDWCDSGFRLFECLVYQRSGVPGAWWSKRFRVDHEYMPVFIKGQRPQAFDKAHLQVPAKYNGVPYHGPRRGKDGLTHSGFATPGAVCADCKCRGTVWKYTSSTQETPKASVIGGIKLQHPATYPDQLAFDHVLCWTNPGAVVLDPFAGSGTTLAMAEKAGRNSIGIEINPEYCAIIRRRMEEVTAQGRLFA